MNVTPSHYTWRAVDKKSAAFPGRSFPASWLVALGILIVCCRLPHIGHVLTWDEAWNLGALRSLASGETIFVERYWFHPPLYMWLGLLLSPASPGFAERMEFLSLAISTGAILAFVRFVSAFFGRRIALFTGIAYALLPGPIFFDTWIKRDSLVTLTCLLAVWCFLRRREYRAGLLLGLGMLSKETAVFYWGAVFLLAMARRPWRKNWRQIILMFSLASLVSGWWFLLAFKWNAGHMEMLKGDSEISLAFLRPWWYYLAKLQIDLGWIGLGLMVTGLVALWPGRGRRSDILGKIKNTRYLPIYLLLPGYVVLSLSRGKPAWMNIVLLPALALLVGLGWDLATTATLAGWAKICRARPGKLKPLVAGLLLVALLVVPALDFDYNGYLERLSPKQARVIETSAEISAVVNAEVKNGERLFILPMLYRSSSSAPDPILYAKLEVKPEILRGMNPDIDYPTFKSIIVRKRVDWVLMSPEVGSPQEMLDSGLQKDIPRSKRRGRRFSVGGLYWVAPLWETGSI